MKKQAPATSRGFCFEKLTKIAFAKGFFVTLGVAAECFDSNPYNFTQI